MVRLQELLALPEEDIKQQLKIIPLTYIQYRMLKNDSIREWYVDNANLTLEFSIPYIRDNKNPNNLIRFIKEGKFEVVNNVDTFVECCKVNKLQIEDTASCVQLIYRSYVQRMLNGTATNWSLNSYVQLLNFLNPIDSNNLWDDATSQVLYKTSESLEFNFNNRKFYLTYVKPHLHELILPTQLEKILPCMNDEDKKFIKSELKKKNHFLGYFEKEDILEILQ